MCCLLLWSPIDGEDDDDGRSAQYVTKDPEAGIIEEHGTGETIEDHGTEEIMENQSCGTNRVMRRVSYKQTKTQLCKSYEQKVRF